jgi:hypothetical protein
MTDSIDIETRKAKMQLQKYGFFRMESPVLGCEVIVMAREDADPAAVNPKLADLPRFTVKELEALTHTEDVEALKAVCKLTKEFRGSSGSIDVIDVTGESLVDGPEPDPEVGTRANPYAHGRRLPIPCIVKRVVDKRPRTIGKLYQRGPIVVFAPHLDEGRIQTEYSGGGARVCIDATALEHIRGQASVIHVKGKNDDGEPEMRMFPIKNVKASPKAGIMKMAGTGGDEEYRIPISIFRKAAAYKPPFIIKTKEVYIA